MRNNKLVAGVIVVVVILIGIALFVFFHKNDKQNSKPTPTLTDILMYSEADFKGTEHVIKPGTMKIFENPSDRFTARSFRIPKEIGLSFMAAKDTTSGALPIWIVYNQPYDRLVSKVYYEDVKDIGTAVTVVGIYSFLKSQPPPEFGAMSIKQPSTYDNMVLMQQKQIPTGIFLYSGAYYTGTSINVAIGSSVNVGAIPVRSIVAYTTAGCKFYITVKPDEASRALPIWVGTTNDGMLISKVFEGLVDNFGVELTVVSINSIFMSSFPPGEFQWMPTIVPTTAKPL